MGREIRRVPPNWGHPIKKKYNPFKRCEEEYRQPMYDKDFDSEFQEWAKNYNLWREGKHPDQQGKESRLRMPFWEWEGGPPDPEYYRPNWEPEEMTWFQIYETVSEGTPVSPPFATQEELVTYLVEYGDFWDQKRGNGGWDRENAEAFVGRGWAMSMMVNTGTGEIKTARDGA